jgi:hypothetical protein
MPETIIMKLRTYIMPLKAISTVRSKDFFHHQYQQCLKPVVIKGAIVYVIVLLACLGIHNKMLSTSYSRQFSLPRTSCSLTVSLLIIIIIIIITAAKIIIMVLVVQKLQFSQFILQSKHLQNKKVQTTSLGTRISIVDRMFLFNMGESVNHHHR